jgi:hypothetical protein
MKQLSRLLISAGFVVCLCSGFSFSQTLADAARQAQAKKKTQTATGHVYTNDNVEFHSAPAEPAPAKTGDAAPDAATNPDGAAKADSPDAAKADADEKAKAADAIKEKYAKQQTDIELLKRELEVLQRENHIRAAVFYSDAGSRLRDPGAYAAADQKYQADIAAKQKAIADGQANLDKIREEARRAGVPLS